MTSPSFSDYRFPPDVIHRAIWLYPRFILSYREVSADESRRREAGIQRPAPSSVRPELLSGRLEAAAHPGLAEDGLWTIQIQTRLSRSGR
jgi:hypothetical protein